MSQNIEQTYDRATSSFKTIAAENLGIPANDVARKRIPKLKKPHPVTSELITVKWEPEDSICFSLEKDLYKFPEIAATVGGITLIPNLGLDFQTATLAYVPKRNGTNLDRYMFRQRFDFPLNPHATSEWDTRLIKDMIFGIKDSGKAIDRMEVEKARTYLKLKQSINAIRNSNKTTLGEHPEIMNLNAGKLRSGAITALSRAAFFGMHFMEDIGIGVDYQLSVDFCRNSRPKLIHSNGEIAVDGHRFEGEFEAFGTYSARKLSEEERVDAIKRSLTIMRESIISETQERGLDIIDTAANKAEFARAQVDINYGLENAKRDNIKAEQFTEQPMYGRLVRLYEGVPEQGLVAVPTPQELREYANIPAPFGMAA